MEPVGFAVGIVGLGGLFSVCLDAVERFDAWKKFDADLAFLGVRVEAERLRLEKWGRDVGLGHVIASRDQKPLGDKVTGKGPKRLYHIALDDERTSELVKKVLFLLKELCMDKNANGASEDPGGIGVKRTNSNYFGISSASKRARVRWALKDKANCMAQVEQIEVLVQKLHDLVPPLSYAGIYERHRPEKAAKRALGGHDYKLSDMIDFHELVPVEARRELLFWLLGPHVPNEVFQMANEKRLEDTCQWLLERPEYINWISPEFADKSAKFLWINGPAGFGKTVLCSKVVEHLRSSVKSPLAFYFFSSDFESRMSPFVAIRSWLAQLSSDFQLFDLLHERYESSHEQTASRTDLTELLQLVLQNFPGCTIIIDGLDECISVNVNHTNHDDTSVCAFLEAISRAATRTNTRIMITSRNDPDISQSLWSLRGVSVKEYKISEKDVRPDIERYSRDVISRKLSNKSEDMQKDLSQKLAERCHGQFLWIKLQEPTLRGGKNRKHLEAAIDKTPTGLEHIYDRNWMAIMNLDPEDCRRAVSILRWAAFAMRPLTVAELTEALLIDTDCAALDIGDLPDCIDDEYVHSEILGICASLVEIRKSDAGAEAAKKTLHFAHFSAKQFFLLRIVERENVLTANDCLRKSAEVTGHSELARVCLQYINMPAVWQDPEADAHPVFQTFRSYAAVLCLEHLSFSGGADVLRLSQTFFQEKNPVYRIWSSWLERHRGATDQVPSVHEQPLCYAVWYNLIETAEALLRDNSGHVNKKSLLEGRPLLEIAAGGGHLRMTQILLDAGAEVNQLSDEHCNALIFASRFGSPAITKLLLDHGADTSLADGEKRTALEVAAWSGHIDVVKILLDAGADVNLSPGGLSPLHRATLTGHCDIVELLLLRDANSAARCSRGWLPLHYAAHRGYLSIVKLLIGNQPTNINATSKEEDTPILYAVIGGQFDVVEYLISLGADISIPDSFGITPLIFAAMAGYQEIVSILLEHDSTAADVNNLNGENLTPIIAAAGSGHLEVVKLLLQHNVDLDVHGQGGASLVAACWKDHSEIVSLLLDAGADIEATNHLGFSPLHVAATCGGTEMVRFLLGRGASIVSTGTLGQTPSMHAIDGGHINSLRLLLDSGDNIRAIDVSGETLLHYAASTGHLDVTKLLLERGLNPMTANKQGKTALEYSIAKSSAAAKLLLDHALASQKSELEVVWLDYLSKAAACDEKYGSDISVGPSSSEYMKIIALLLEIGADVCACADCGTTPLHRATQAGNIDAVQCLIDDVACVKATRDCGWTPLPDAAAAGSTSAAKLLMDAGADFNCVIEETGITPLIIACKSGNTGLVELLIDRGANVAAKDSSGGTPLLATAVSGSTAIASHLLRVSPGLVNDTDSVSERSSLSWAVQFGDDPAMIELFLSASRLEPESRDRFGQTALSFAVRLRRCRFARLLLSSGKFSLLSKDSFGRTPLSWAKELGYSDIDEFLGGGSTDGDGLVPDKASTHDDGENAADDTDKNENEGDDGNEDDSEKYLKTCDVCLMEIGEGDASHCCEACWDGNSFDICARCYELGARCANPDHTMIARIR
ncbi:hypothetical protein PWT90_02524 [Aphanocladium album]|nr:hypothetical protein PWT90_02524 [Aphanocladium album]